MMKREQMTDYVIQRMETELKRCEMYKVNRPSCDDQTGSVLPTMRTGGIR